MGVAGIVLFDLDLVLWSVKCWGEYVMGVFGVYLLIPLMFQ